MVEQDFDVGGDDAAAMLVDAVVQFFLYLGEAVEDGLPLALGHMQGFVHFVGEECVFLHFLCKARASQQVGMEQQTIAFGIGRFTAVVNTCHLSGSHEKAEAAAETMEQLKQMQQTKQPKPEEEEEKKEEVKENEPKQ